MAGMLDSDKRRRLIVPLAAVVLLASCGSIVFRVARERAWQAQRGQIEQAHLYGPDGRDIRKPMASLDEMYGYVGARVQQEVSDSRYQRLPSQEKIRRNDALFKAMSDEIKRVTDSHYTKPFDKNAIESEYRHILWVDRLRGCAPALAASLLLPIPCGLTAVHLARQRSRRGLAHAN